MNRAEIEKRTTAIIVEGLGVEKNQVTDEALLVDDLGADSLDFVEGITRIEEDFDNEIDDDEAEKIRTVKDLFDLIETSLSK